MRAFDSFYSTRPLVIAHRGASGAAPENTLAAFRAARVAGADAIELDVTRCATGEIVVIHDDTLDRTTNGSGRVASTPFATLRALDAGAWFGDAFAGERVPLLAEVLDAVGGTLRVNIEIKGLSPRGDGIEAEIAALVRSRGLDSSVIVSSFNATALARMRRTAPELQRALLFVGRAAGLVARAVVLGIEARWMAGADALHPRATDVDAAWARAQHTRGYRVNVWTVNDVDAMRRMVSAGVDGIITNHPERLRALLDRTEDLVEG